MGFLAPWFLAGLVAAGLPLWLHLLRRHRAEPRRFSSLMFFERRAPKSIRHRRLRYLLLLSLRLALLALLAVAFANPYVTRAVAPGAGGRKLALLVIDDSFSMRHGGALERAKREALAVVASLPAGSQGQVVALDSQVHFLSPAVEDRQQLRAALESVSATDSRSSYGELARAARSVAQSARAPVEVHLFSDMQKSSLPAALADFVLPGQAQLVLHATAEARRPNWAVESVNAPRRLFGSRKARVQATIAGFGAPAARRTVSLAVNGRVVETRTVEIPENGRAAVEFPSLDVPYGLNRGEVRISPADALPEDDRFFFALERADPSRILFVHEARQPRGLLYFRAALEASSEAAFTLEAVTTDQAGGVSPSKYAAVVLSDVAAMPASFENALRSFVRAGGSLLVAVGPAASTRPRVPVFDEAILEARYAARAGERFQSAGFLDAAHPSVRRANRWEGVKFYQVIRIEPGSARVVARLADETPLLLEKRIGEGRVLVFASTFDNLSNDFPLHAAFVAFVGETARYLSGEEDRPSNLPVDAHLELRSGKDQGPAVEVLGPEGRRALSLEEAATARTLQVARAGFYEVHIGSGRDELVAVNPDRRESDLEVIPKETLALWQHRGLAARAPAGGAPVTEARPWPLWWYVMLLALAVALAESLAASRYMKVTDA